MKKPAAGFLLSLTLSAAAQISNINPGGGADADPADLLRNTFGNPREPRLAAQIAGVLDSLSSRPFRIVIIPDSQDLPRQSWESQTRWIGSNATPLNILAALHVGDVVSNPDEGAWAHRAPELQFLGNTPFLLVPGNHDYDIWPSNNLSSRALKLWNTQVGQSLYTGKTWWHGGFFTNGASENLYLTVTSGATRLLLFGLEFGPRTNVLRWVSNVAAAHPDHTAIITTHNYLMPDGTRNGMGGSYNPHQYRMDDACDGEEMWNLIKFIPNLHFVVSGHQVGWPRVAHSIDCGMRSNRVSQVLCNWQGCTNQHLGALMLWTFHPDRGEVLAETYSPVTDFWDRSATNEFKLPMSSSAAISTPATPGNTTNTHSKIRGF